jgi:uncharacterized DUF497 family protein
VAESFVYAFEWDLAKAAENLAKHRVAFETAATVRIISAREAKRRERENYENAPR